MIETQAVGETNQGYDYQKKIQDAWEEWIDNENAKSSAGFNEMKWASNDLVFMATEKAFTKGAV